MTQNDIRSVVASDVIPERRKRPMENTNIIIDMDQAYDESLEKIFELLEEKKYFR